MKKSWVILISLILVSIGPTAVAEVVHLDKQNLFVVQVSITGKRGTLSFPALIDTGASHSFIPRSVADGVGYDRERTAKYVTATGESEFQVIRVKELSFMGLSFSDLEVAITEPPKKDDWSFKVPPIGQNGRKAPKAKPKKQEEIAVIGMSELSKVRFVYENGAMTFSSAE